ncbi:hypothetical protein GIB67_042907, partial [Kingdonia uniflora]
RESLDNAVVRCSLLILSSQNGGDRSASICRFAVEECKFIFEAKTIQRMKLLVLSTLKWIMRAVAPFTFMDYFFLSISVITETNLDKYEPYFIKNVLKERVFKYLELIHELQRSAAVQSVPQSPIEVLDFSCLSYKSEELPTMSSANSSQEDSDFKRVNLNKPSDMD